jgi:hypothetical protein
MVQVFKMTDTLKAELPRKLAEHRAIVAALERLIEASKNVINSTQFRVNRDALSRL